MAELREEVEIERGVAASLPSNGRKRRTLPPPWVEAKDRFSPSFAVPGGVGERPEWFMKIRSRDQGRTAGVGSVKRRSPGGGVMGEQQCSFGPGVAPRCAASRLALRATACGGCGHDPARRALRPSDGRHGVPARVSVGPAVAIPEHGVNGSEHFAHDRDDRDLRLLAGVTSGTT